MLLDLFDMYFTAKESHSLYALSLTQGIPFIISIIPRSTCDI